MKKLIAIAVITSLMPVAAFAAVTVTPTSLGGPNPMEVSQAWGLTGTLTPTIAIGSYVTDKWGYKSYCSAVAAGYRGFCFDISSTQYYIDLMTKAFGSR